MNILLYYIYCKYILNIYSFINNTKLSTRLILPNDIRLIIILRGIFMEAYTKYTANKLKYEMSSLFYYTNYVQ